MKLTGVDRFLIRKLYPEEAKIITQILVKGIAKKVDFTEEEGERLTTLRMAKNENREELTNEDVNHAVPEIDIEFTDAELEFLKDRVNKLDDAGKVTLPLVDLCVKIRDEK